MTQAAGQTPSCPATLSPTTQSTGASGGGYDVALTTSCNWSLSIDANWITLVTPSSGSGNAKITYNVAGANATRSGHITVLIGGVAAATVTVTQTVDAPPPACTTASLSPTTQASGGSGGSYDVTLTTACAWSLNIDANWITLATAQSGTGNAKITYNVASTSAARSGHITVMVGGAAAATLTVNQTADTTPPPLTADFTFKQTVSTDSNTCLIDQSGDSNFPALIRCEFNASNSSPASQIVKYEFVLQNTGKSLGTGVKLTEPKTSCGFPYDSEVTIRLTITSSDSHTATKDVTLFFKRGDNGPC